MYCHNCGKEIVGVGIYCQSCGAKQKGEPEKAYNEAVPNRGVLIHTEPTEGWAQKLKDNSKALKIAALIIAANVVIGAVILLVINVFPKSQKELSVAELLDLGEKYLLDLNYEQALVQFLAVIEVEPRTARAYIGAAEAYIGMSDIDNAIDVLQQGLENISGNEEITALLDSLREPEEIEEPPVESENFPVIEVTPTDWKQLYYEKILELMYTDESMDYETFYIADLNFDGIPELLFGGGGGAHGLELIQIFTLNQDKIVMISDHEIGGANEFKLLQNEAKGTLFWWIDSYGSSGATYGTGTIYLTSNSIPLNRDFITLSILVEYMFDYDADILEFNEQIGSVYEFDRLIKNLMIGYQIVEYEMASLNSYDWSLDFDNYWDSLTDADIQAFLDSYIPETTFYNAADLSN